MVGRFPVDYVMIQKQYEIMSSKTENCHHDVIFAFHNSRIAGQHSPPHPFC